MATDEYATSASSAAISACGDAAVSIVSVPELMNLGHDAFDHQEYNLAANFFQAALSTLEDQYKVTKVATDGIASPLSCSSVAEYELAVASSHLGKCCMALGRTEDALLHYQQELCYKRLYYNYTTDGNDDGSTSSNEESSAECSHKELRNVNLDLALSIERVGEALILVGDYKTAKRHYHEALDMKRLVYGKEQQHSLLQPNNARPTVSALQVPNASSIRSFDSFKPTVYGYDLVQNTDIAFTNVQLGVICQYLRQFHKARNYYAAALSMYRSVYSEPNEFNFAQPYSKFENRPHGDKRETFDTVEVKPLQPPTTKESNVDDVFGGSVKHIDIVKVLAQLGSVNAVMGKTDIANLYFDEARMMVRQLIDSDNNVPADLLLYTKTLQIIQNECKRVSEKKDPSTENHHPITWSDT